MTPVGCTIWYGRPINKKQLNKPLSIYVHIYSSSAVYYHKPIRQLSPPEQRPLFFNDVSDQETLSKIGPT